MGLGDTRNLRRALANQAWSVEILLTVSDESDKINTQDWSWNITVDTVGLLSLMHQVFIFILKCIVYAAFCGLLNLATSRVAIAKTCRWHRLDNSNLKGMFCSCIQLHRFGSFESAIQATTYIIVLFEPVEHIFANEWLKATLCDSKQIFEQPYVPVSPDFLVCWSLENSSTTKAKHYAISLGVLKTTIEYSRKVLDITVIPFCVEIL